jgi:serine/threonine-protein kinase
MNPERERLALEHLEAALGWARGERERRLNETLAHDAELLAEVRALLANADAVNDALPTGLPVAIAAGDAAPPERLGPYRIGALLGSGGMGRVYRGERDDGVFEQTIAVKLMRRTRQPLYVAEQFARERQILARLQHRNIAQLFDGGITPDGHSYFIMELVAGRTIVQYAVEKELGARETLLLFLPVCAAASYAHAHLVVHADIKPSNILVTADGTVKLLDFGVARVLADAGESAESRSQPLALTYDYASPARRKGEAATTPDDIYSLGVLLIELLRRAGVVDEELRSICRRATAEQPADRYVSVDALQGDIERWLDGEPVHAHGSDWRYVGRKFLARHRVSVSVSALGVLLLAVAAVALGVLYVRAERAKAEANERFNELRSLSRYVLFDVYDRLEAVPRALTLRRDIAEAGQRYLDRLAQDPGAPLAVRLEVVEGLRRLAQVQANYSGASLAQVPLAQANLDRAAALASALPEDADRRMRSLILTRIALARSRLTVGSDLNLPEAQRALDSAGTRLASLLKENPNDAEARGLQVDVEVEQAALLQWQGQYTGSVGIARRALEQASAVDPQASSPDRSAALRRARLLDILAEGTYYGGDPAAAETSYREELGLLQQLSARLPQDVGVSRQLERAQWALGSTLLQLQRPREAEQVLSQAVALAERLRILEPDDQDLVRSASVASNALAQALAALKRFDAAIPLLQQSLDARRRLWDQAPTDWSAARDYAITLASLADVQADSGNVPQACGRYRETLAVFDRIRDAGRLAKLDQDYALQLIHERMQYHCR